MLIIGNIWMVKVIRMSIWKQKVDISGVTGVFTLQSLHRKSLSNGKNLVSSLLYFTS